MNKKIILPVLLVLLQFSVKSQKISEWREEHRTGVSAETGLLKAWPAVGPTLLWTNTGLGKGYSSVSFGSNAIYTTGIKDSLDILHALSPDGAMLWETPIGRAWTESFPESRATPTVEGNFVYTASGYGDLACIDGTTGKTVWTYKASELNNGTYGKWGIAESILIDGNTLYFSPAGAETMTIALDKTSGQLLWRSVILNDKPGYG